ncbi:response regulator [Legionella lytica]|uniref:Response regulator n=1 Tax=Legionella lytica TaxID=96232 RepID=A0ABW8DAT6_9GAMM
MDTNKRILIVDDFGTMRKLLKGMLVKLGFNEITEAENAPKAWDILQEGPCDLVISDYNMPDMTGMELLEKVRQDGALSTLPFILLTAEDDVDLIIESKKHNVSAYILKPFKIEVIESKLQSVFAG